jgi:hypothetical protein
MTMRDAASIVAALSLYGSPHMTRVVRRSPLPSGMTFLLEVAAGEPDALDAAQGMTSLSPSALRDAAGFFIEQILFAPSSDHYRALGLDASATTQDLRRHMALLMKWLHPDTAQPSRHGIDPSLFVGRVTDAWGTLKSDEKRADYDRALSARPVRLRKSSRLLPKSPKSASGSSSLKTVASSPRHAPPTIESSTGPLSKLFRLLRVR